jgi:hypothetical protein
MEYGVFSNDNQLNQKVLIYDFHYANVLYFVATTCFVAVHIAANPIAAAIITFCLPI